MGRSVANCRVLLRAGMSLDEGSEPLTICISIDVERDYRLDGAFTTRGIEDGLPPVVDLLRSRELPFDLFVSGEIADRLPATLAHRLTAIGCHGLRHPRGHRSYLNRMTVVAQRRQISEATERVRTATGTTPIHCASCRCSITAARLAHPITLTQNGFLEKASRGCWRSPSPQILSCPEGRSAWAS